MSCLATGCSEPTAPARPPFLAIVTRLTTWPGATAPATITYRVRQSTAGVVAYDEQMTVAPRDTIIVPLTAGTYIVETVDLPARCVIPSGATQQGITLTDEDNTGIIRYRIECRGLLGLSVITDGWNADDEFVFRVRNATANREQSGVTAANDTMTFQDIGAGELTVDIGGVAPNCVITSDGGARQRITARATGGAAVAFRVQCADPARQPQLLTLTGGYTQGASIFQFRVFDPDADMVGYYWDITDCEGNSVLPDRRERVRLNIQGGRGATRDTLTIVGAFELGLETSALIGRCTEIRVFDAANNVSRIATHKIGNVGGSPPAVRFFNATLNGTAFISSLLEASDPDGDLVGHFVLVRLRDGVLAAPDGVPDLGSMDPAGYLGTEVPNIPTTGRIKWDDVYAVMVYLIDARGNVVRVQDDDIFR